MPARFDPLSALEGSFLGVPFKISRERGEGGRRGPLHEYPDRDEPLHEDMGRKALRFELGIYFVGADADLRWRLFDTLLWKGRAGPLILPGLRRERMKAVSWSHDRDRSQANWVACQVTFVEPGRNQFPVASTSWPHALLEAAGDAQTAIADALGSALDTIGVGQEVFEDLGGFAGGLGLALDAAAALAAGESPATVLASAALLTVGYVADVGPALEVVAFAVATTTLLANWADTIVGSSSSAEGNRPARARAIDALWYVYESAAVAAPAAPEPETLAAMETIMLANRGAASAAVRRSVLAQIGRQAASLTFASYDDAAALRGRLADAFDAEIDIAGDPTAPGGRSDAVRAALQDLQAAALQAISAAGADKAKLVPYAVTRPRPALALAQLFYGEDADVVARARELTARTGAIHPAFLPAAAERLSR